MDFSEIVEFTFEEIIEKELIEDITQVSQILEFKQYDVLIDFGQYMRGMPLLIKGAIKIMREDFDEGELLLYFLEKGDTCAMTMSCCMGNNKSEKIGRASCRERI